MIDMAGSWIAASLGLPRREIPLLIHRKFIQPVRFAFHRRFQSARKLYFIASMQNLNIDMKPLGPNGGNKKPRNFPFRGVSRNGRESYSFANSARNRMLKPASSSARKKSRSSAAMSASESALAWSRINP